MRRWRGKVVTEKLQRGLWHQILTFDSACAGVPDGVMAADAHVYSWELAEMQHAKLHKAML